MHATLNCYSNVKNIDYGITSLNKGVMKVIYYLLHLLSILVNGYNSSNGIKVFINFYGKLAWDTIHNAVLN